MAPMVATAAPTDAGALLRVRGVSVRYGAHRALDGVDLDVRPGELVALAGENGAGKSTLVRCIAGDIVPDGGEISVSDRSPRPGGRPPVAVVWQDLSLCDNLDVAANVMLGRESRRLMLSPSRLHAHARQLLADLGIPLFATTQLVDTLSGGQRQLLAVARAMRDRPGLLVLDEPTAALGVAETKQVEELTVGLRRCGVSVLLVSHDVEQMFRLADRIVVLRHGRVVDDLRPADSHPDEVTALITGQEVDVSARRQLDRLHGLVDRLASAEPGSAVALVLSSLATALRGGRLALHVVHDDGLEQVATLGLPMTLRGAWRRLPIGAAGGPAGMAAATGQPTVDIDAPPASGQVGSASSWRAAAGVGAAASAWAVPIQGSAGVLGAITHPQGAGAGPHR